MDTRGTCDDAISIQSFQHGGLDTSRGLFTRADSVLRLGGLLFLRVNSDRTGIRHEHRVVERDGGGTTVMYEEGPKRGLLIRFLTGEGIRDLAGGFDILRMDHATEPRASGGSWSRW